MSTPQERPRVVQQTDLPMEPLTQADARRAEEEALHRTLQTSEEVSESRRRGRIEAETRRVSEEVTRQAQERLRLERSRLEPAATPTSVVDERREDLVAPAPGRALPKPMTIERLLVPLDGTPYSERALPFALAFASWANASIALAHINEPERSRARATLSKAVDSTTPESAAQRAPDVATYLNTIRDRVVTAVPRVETIMLNADSAADGIAAVIEQAHADVVLLATHARQGLERRILGSVGDQLIQRTRVPVLLIPPGLGINPDQTQTFQRVLVPLDGSMLAEQALAPVLALARLAGSNGRGGMEIVLFYVADSQVTRPDGVRYVQDVRERLIQAQLPDSVRLTATAMVGSPPGSITSAAIHGVITEPAYPRRFDFVAMATHGRGGFQRWLYGSVAEYVLSHVTVPTLLVHPESTDM